MNIKYHKLEYMSLSITTSLVWSLPVKNPLRDSTLVALPTLIKLGRKWLTITNTLAYYDLVLFTAIRQLTHISLEPARVEPFAGLKPKGWLLALSTNIRLERMWLTMTNTLAYYDLVLITAIR